MAKQPVRAMWMGNLPHGISFSRLVDTLGDMGYGGIEDCWGENKRFAPDGDKEAIDS